MLVRRVLKPESLQMLQRSQNCLVCVLPAAGESLLFETLIKKTNGIAVGRVIDEGTGPAQLGCEHSTCACALKVQPEATWRDKEA